MRECMVRKSSDNLTAIMICFNEGGISAIGGKHDNKRKATGDKKLLSNYSSI